MSMQKGKHSIVQGYGYQSHGQETQYVNTPASFMQQQSGPAGGGGQHMRLALSNSGPPQSGPPQSQPTPTSTPPGVQLQDMKPNNHLPGQSQMTPNNLDYSNQMFPARPPGNQNFHMPRMQQPARLTRTPQMQQIAPNTLPTPTQLHYMPIYAGPQGVVMNIPAFQAYQNQRHPNPNSNFFPAGHTTQSIPVPLYYGGNHQIYNHPIVQRYPTPHNTQSPITQQTGAPHGTVTALSNLQQGMVQAPQVPVLETKRVKKPIPIINPETLLEVDVISGDNNNGTPPRSNDSSARQTPQPELDKNVAVEFAEKVALAAVSSGPPVEINGPPVNKSISNDNDRLHKQSVPNSEININKVTHQLQTNVANFVPKTQPLPQLPPQQQCSNVQNIVETSPIAAVQVKEEIRQTGTTPIVSAVTNSPAVEIHRGERQHKDYSNIGKSVPLPVNVVQSPNRTIPKKQKPSESERHAITPSIQPLPLSHTNVVIDTPFQTSASEPIASNINKKFLKTNQKEETPSMQPKERRDKSRCVSKEQTPPVVCELTQDQALNAPVATKGQFHNTNNSKGFSNVSPIQTPIVVSEDVSAQFKQQSNGEISTSGENVDHAGNRTSQKQKKNKGSKMRGDLNRRGNEKEGTDMDAFTTEPAISVAEEREVANSSPTPPVIQPQLSPPTEIKIKDDLEETEEKLVAIKNEENDKISKIKLEEELSIIEKPVPVLKYNYAQDQWSPHNLDGKRKYGREFLLGLQNEPQSRKKPDDLFDLEPIMKDTSNRQIRGNVQNNMFSMRQHDMITPGFMYNKSSSSQRGSITKKGSNQGKGIKGGKPNVIHLSLSLHEDVKLRESENAWKPKVRGAIENKPQDEKENEELYKKVRGILNKLTPQKFDKLMNQVNQLPINTVNRLKKVIDLVFEKAVDEPGFSKAYALMCKTLSSLEITYQNEVGEDVKCNFRKLIITKCQSEFESEKHSELNVDKRLEEIKNCTDPEKKKEMQSLFEEDERKVRMKSVGNVRFIGELYKLQMLTSAIMFRCLQQLLKKPEEESLECLCKLLTTIGKDLEHAKESAQLQPIFSNMLSLSQKHEHSKVSSRVRFMLQDVIDLRKNNWVPRRDENNPKTMDQITKDAEKESLEMSMQLNMPPNRNKNYDNQQDDRRGGRSNRNNQGEDGWTVSTGKNSYRMQISFDQSKLSGIRSNFDEMSFGSSNQFRNFNNNPGSQKSSEKGFTMNNMYSALRNEEKKPPSNSMMSRPPPKITPSPSLEKERINYGNNESIDGRQSRGSSLQRDRPPPQTPSRDSSVSRQSNTPAPSNRLCTDDPDEVKRISKSIIDEYLNLKKLEECKLSIEDRFNEKTMHHFIQQVFELGLDVKNEARTSIGQLLVYLFKTSVVTPQHLIDGSSFLIECGEDMSIDVPKFWEYLAELMVPIICEEKITLADVKEAASGILQNQIVENLLTPIFKLLVQKMGPDFVKNCLVSSKITLEDFLLPGRVENFVEKNNLQFLIGGNCNTRNPLPMNEVENLLTQHIRCSSIESIKSWIAANVGEELSKTPLFIHTLGKAVCEVSFNKKSNNISLDENLFKEYGKVLMFYVDNKEERELALINAIQALVTKLEHPKGVLTRLFTLLFEDGVVSVDSFLKWKDGAEVEGKGVSVKSLNSFFVMLQECESEDETS
uniref:MI domain-containing protein n=1 Tax=Clastoptera arizonana TaxID=38151 RepID=A0A1B6CCD2_9HEMI